MAIKWLGFHTRMGQELLMEPMLVLLTLGLSHALNFGVIAGRTCG